MDMEGVCGSSEQYSVSIHSLLKKESLPPVGPLFGFLLEPAYRE